VPFSLIFVESVQQKPLKRFRAGGGAVAFTGLKPGVN